MCLRDRLNELYFWVPQSGSIGVGISILSYAGQVYFGMISDAALVEEPADVIARIRPNFEALRAAAAAEQQRKPTPAKRGRSAPPKRPRKTTAGRAAAGKTSRKSASKSKRPARPGMARRPK